ncbi:hypothetical protein U9M48_038910, partial [Paspalum notatum var. saurae]
MLFPCLSPLSLTVSLTFYSSPLAGCSSEIPAADWYVLGDREIHRTQNAKTGQPLEFKSKAPPPPTLRDRAFERKPNVPCGGTCPPGFKSLTWHGWRLHRQRGACGDFVNLEMPVQSSSTDVLIGVECACVFIG